MGERPTLGVAFSHDSRLYGAPRSLLLALAAFPDPSMLRLVVPAPGALADAAVELGVRVTVLPRPEAPTRLQRIRTALRVRRQLAAWRPQWAYVNTMAHAGPVWAADSLGLPVVLHVREHAGYFAPRQRAGSAPTAGAGGRVPGAFSACRKPRGAWSSAPARRPSGRP